VLSRAEVLHFLGCVKDIKHQAILTTCYAAGLRISEAFRLKANSLDNQRMVIRVAHGKGHKDRYVMLSPKLLDTLRDYWRIVRPKDWLFPGYLGQPITTHAVEQRGQPTTRERRLCLRVPPGIGHANLRHLNVAADGTVEMPESEAESFLRAGWVRVDLGEKSVF